MSLFKRKSSPVAPDTELRLLFAEAQELIEEGAVKLRQANELLETSINQYEEHDDPRGVPPEDRDSDPVADGEHQQPL